MWEWLIPVLIVVALIVIVGIYFWATYNSLVQLNVRVDEAWSDITVQLKRRADLIPGLIETVKGYAAHERAVFENVTQARAETLSASGPAEAGVAEGHVQDLRHLRRGHMRVALHLPEPDADLQAAEIGKATDSVFWSPLNISSSHTLMVSDEVCTVHRA